MMMTMMMILEVAWLHDFTECSSSRRVCCNLVWLAATYNAIATMGDFRRRSALRTSGTVPHGASEISSSVVDVGGPVVKSPYWRLTDNCYWCRRTGTSRSQASLI